PPPPRPVAGPSSFVVAVHVEGAAEPVTVPGTLDVAPVVDLAASLGAEGAGGYPLTVRNRGNVDVRATLIGAGGSSLEITVEPGTLDVAPGDVATAQVAVRRKRRSGSERSPFEIYIRPEGAPAITVTGATGGPEPSRSTASARPRRSLFRVALPLVLAVALIGGVLVQRGGEQEDAVGVDETAPAIDTGPLPECPARNHIAPDANGRDPQGEPFPRDYAFLEAQADGCQPVRFNPCEPIHYVVNDELAPPGAAQDLQQAAQRLSEVTGITFVDEGRTDERAVGAFGRSAYQPERYGERWAPVLIAWGPGRDARLQDTNPGGGRPTHVRGTYVSGFIVLNVDAVTADRKPLSTGFGPGATWGRVLLHELSHLLGLGHVASRDQLMFTDLGGQTGRADFGRGDRLALRAIGREAGCLTTPPLPPARPR
ncbi:MAG: hypothetical protein ABR540_22565, partial [Acidimicrobiales bacterium]